MALKDMPLKDMPLKNKSRKKASLTKFGIDGSPHNMDGLRLLAQDGTEPVEAFIGRKVMDVWVESIEHREHDGVCSANSTMRWANATSQRSSGS